MKEAILHATLTNNHLVLMASDVVSDSGLKRGNAVSLMLNCSSENEIKTCYKSLSEGGTSDQPLEETFFGALLGNLTDRYGNHWLLNYTRA